MTDALERVRPEPKVARLAGPRPERRPWAGDGVCLGRVLLEGFDVLRIPAGAEYLRAFEANRLEVLARLSIGAHGAAYGVGLVLAGLRSTTFCYLWFKSDFIPRALALFGVLASLLMGVCSFSFIIVPELERVVPVAIYGGPIFIFELTMGLWLVLKGLARDSGDRVLAS